jgi:plastocyanin
MRRGRTARVRVRLLATGLLALTLAACGDVANVRRAEPTAGYRPQTRDFVVTTVPLQIHEMQGMLPFLQKDFAKGGVLDGKEVYGFYPSTLAVYQGDKVHLTVVDPQDDAHTFTIHSSALSVNLSVQGQSSAGTTFVARTPGIYTFFCSVPEHTPYQWGELIVLPQSAAPPG